MSTRQQATPFDNIRGEPIDIGIRAATGADWLRVGSSRQLQQRWGSMTSCGKLILNRSLIRSSVDAIDYVITHELCHLRFRHHGAEFFQLLDRVMPDWESRKIKLERRLA
jgi:predicted metal-dependent hydrolase